MSHAPVLFELDLQAVLQRPMPALAALPRQLPVERDLAVVVAEGVTHEQLQQCVRGAAVGARLLDVTLFDIYRPKPGAEAAAGMSAGEKSMALRLVLDDAEGQSLADERIDAAVGTVLAALQAQLGARLRA